MREETKRNNKKLLTGRDMRPIRKMRIRDFGKAAEDFNETDVRSAPEEDSIRLLHSLDEIDDGMQVFYTEMTKSGSPETFGEEVQIRKRTLRRTASNILKAYSHTISIDDELTARYRDLVKGKNRKILPTAPANAVIDLAETQSHHFAQGLNPYKLMLLCFIGSFVGVVIEMLWCVLTRGHIESRAGLVWGPFNLLYGAGAVALTLALYRFRNKGKWLSFLGGMLTGSVVEYLCSLFQEMFFGSRSWDYTGMPFNINGRICLLYSVFWGILGVLWVKQLYPWVAKLILKIPNRWGRAVTWLLTAFLALNAVVSVLAVFRWSQRVEGIAAANGFWQFVDARFPDERMARIFANMEFGS